MNEIIILREDYSHMIQKSDVWLVYTTKSNRPWICVPGGFKISEDMNTILLKLATKPSGGYSHD